MMIVRIASFPSFDDDKEKKMRVIGHAVNAFGEGKNVLWMPKKLVDYLLDHEGLSDYHRRVLYKLKSFVVESKNLHEDYRYHMEISFEDKDACEICDDHKMVLGYGNLLDSSFWQKPSVVVENAIDADIYKHSAISRVVEKNSYNACDIRFSCRSGGGASTYEVFLRTIDEVGNVLCILDSDKGHPNGPLGSTARRFNDYDRGLNSHYFLKVLASRELENVIPIKLATDVVQRTNNRCLAYFESMLARGGRQYFDYKKGLTVEQALDLDERHEGDYWKPIVSGATDDWLCPGLGDHMAAHCRDDLNSASAHKISSLADKDKDWEWIEIGELMAAWCLCLKRTVS